MTSSSSFQLDGGSLSLHRAIIEQAQDAVIFADRGARRVGAEAQPA